MFYVDRDPDLSVADFRNVTLTRGDLTNAVFTGANVPGATFRDVAVFTGADVPGATFRDVTCPDGTSGDDSDDGLCDLTAL